MAPVESKQSDRISTNTAIDEAVSAEKKGNWRLSADKYLDAFQIGTDDLRHRYRNLCKHSHILLFHLKYFPTRSDYSNLKTIVKDQKETKCCQAMAAWTFAVLRWEHDRRETAAEFYRHAIFLAESAPVQERRMIVLVPVQNRDVQKSIDQVLTENVTKWKNELHVLENPFISADGKVQNYHITAFDSPSSAPPSTDPRLFSPQMKCRLAVGGDRCDFCKKTLEQLGGKTILDRCGLCKMAYYCSKKCRRKDWNEGHEEKCRSRGEIKSNDIMLLGKMEKNPEVSDCVVRVVRPHGRADENRWAVEILGSDKKVSVKRDNLIRLRPV